MDKVLLRDKLKVLFGREVSDTEVDCAEEVYRESQVQRAPGAQIDWGGLLSKYGPTLVQLLSDLLGKVLKP